VRSTAEALRAYAKSRRMGIDAENQAAEVVIRAEWKIGRELARMAEEGERATQAGANLAALSRLEDLGIERHRAADWQKLGTIDAGDLDDLLTEALARPGCRLARTDLVRLYFGEPVKAPKPGTLRRDTDEWTAPLAKITDGAAARMVALDNGWPLASDRTPRGWVGVCDQIATAARALLLLEQRAKAHATAQEAQL
jgi:hypothetical protein